MPRIQQSLEGQITSIDPLGSYSASGIFPPKLLQNDDIITGDGLIVPVHPQLLPTNVCNLNCSFCSCKERDKKLSLPWEKAQQILHAFASFGAKAITITGGGEPLLYPKINELFELALSLGIRIGLVTNGMPTVIERLRNTDLTWVRVSVSDKMKMDSLFLRGLSNAIMRTPQIDWAFSYVLTKNPDYVKLAALLKFADEHDFTHMRIVSDLTDLDNVPEMDEVRIALAMMPGEHLVIYQERKAYTKGHKRCLISLLKPVIGPDGGIWPCCGVQYALSKPTNDMEASMRMGDWTDFRDIMQKQRCFNGSVCARCYYENYNQLLDLMTRRIEHKEFV